MTNLFFVYGTLKSGYGNNRLLSTSRLVGPATSFEAQYKMCCVGFPYLFKDGENKVLGEVWDTDSDLTRKRLDGLEGYPSHYTREIHPFILTTGEVVDAWVYLHPNPSRYDGAARKILPNKSGILDWKGYNNG